MITFLFMPVNAAIHLFALACKFHWKQHKQLLKATFQGVRANMPARSRRETSRRSQIAARVARRKEVVFTSCSSCFQNLSTCSTCSTRLKPQALTRDHELAAWRALTRDHEKSMGRPRRVARNYPLRGRHEKHTKSARGGYTGGDNRAWATQKTHGLFATCIFCECKFCYNSRHESSNDIFRRVLRHSRCGLRGLPRTWKRF